MAHSSWLWVAPRPCSGSAIVRSATFSTVLSSTTTSRLMTRTPRMAQRRGCPACVAGVSMRFPAFRNETVPYSRENLDPPAVKRNVSVSECAADHEKSAATRPLPNDPGERRKSADLRDVKIPAAGRLRDDDWRRRHRLLTTLLAATVVGLTVFGAFSDDGLTRSWLFTVLIVLPCAVAAARLPGRRLPSVAVALGFTAFCGGFVAMCHGLTEAHFSFFIVVAALALYR